MFAPLERNSIVNSVLLPELRVPSILRQLAKPAPQIELGISPVVFTSISVPSVATKRILIFGLRASSGEPGGGLVEVEEPGKYFLSSLNKFKI